MYRYILPLLLWHAVAGAPKALSDSDITYVKSQPPIEPPSAPKHVRESRIENLPLTIPGIVTLERTEGNRTDAKKIDEELKNYERIEVNLTDTKKIDDVLKTIERITEEAEETSAGDITLPESSNLSEITALPDSPNNVPDFIQSDSKNDANVPEETGITHSDAKKSLEESPAENEPEKSQAESITEKSDELLEAHSDTVPAETNQSDRRGRNFDSIETTDIFEEQTIPYEDVSEITEAPRFKPKFIPKSSYFKPQVFSFPRNSVEKSAKRRFRSNCRCEKIWNCPKLQISVPRCPNEYFLCCF